ncbi:D-psicose/D-tagatose/L-ribulose 3-epimerase [Leifsonia sp. EB41]|uniref:sugar phosphate isomerase/epimerase family protein n=1 Tax=Leifsonia sp. EB41 TaxID=3156260 RepID=UPI00351850C6
MTWLLAANTFIWHSPLTDEILADRLPRLADWGFDAVELPLENLGDWDPERTRDLLAQTGLSAVVGAVFAPGRELAAADEATQSSTLHYMRTAIDVAHRQGSDMVIGPAYTSVGRTWRLSPVERSSVLAELTENYRRLADYAGERGVRIALEPLNRYETSLFNTTAQLLEFIEPFDSAVIGLNLDTYHMNIEERSFADPLRAAGDRLLHLQVCGNDRGAPGDDLTPWDEIFGALDEIAYTGLLGIESFTADNASIATAASIWRPLAPTQDQLAQDGLRFLRAERARYGAGR